MARHPLHAIAVEFLQGLQASCSAHKSIIYFLTSKQIQLKALQCLLLNGLLFIGSLLIFDYLLIPLIQYLLTVDLTTVLQLQQQTVTAASDASTASTSSSAFIDVTILLFYRCLWLYPIYTISFILSTIWYQDIATHAYDLEHGGKKGSKSSRKPITFVGWLTSMAEELYRQLLFFTFFIQTEALAVILPSTLQFIISSTKYLPASNQPSDATLQLLQHYSQYVTLAVYCVHLSWYYALYAYDYRFSLQHTPLNARLETFETHWSYYCGFGLPSAVLTLVFPKFFNAGVFALTFPVFLILAIIAPPIESTNKQHQQSDVPTLPLFKLSKAVNYRLLTAANKRHKAV